MIYDSGTEFALNHPGGTAAFSTGSYDLTGGSDGVPALFGTGERLYMQFEVTTAFTVSTGTPLVLFGVAVGPAATLDATSHVLALSGGSINGNRIGFTAGQLTLGRIFHVPIPMWEDIHEEDSADWPNTIGSSELTTFRGLQFMGAVSTQVGDRALAAFGAGAVVARIVKDPAGTAVLSNQFPSRMTVS